MTDPSARAPSVVIGAGIIGACVAAGLQRDGHAVVLIDHDDPGSGASSGNGGVLSISSIIPVAMLSYMPTFLQQHVGLDRSQALWSNTLALLLLVAAVPAAGALSDRIGRKPLLLASCAALLLLPYPLFAMLLSSPSLPTVIAVQVLFALAIALFSGPGPAAIAEIFPTRMRSTWMSIGYSLAVALFGGFAPYVATWLIARTGSPLAPTWYVIGAAVVSAITIATHRETAHEELR